MFSDEKQERISKEFTRLEGKNLAILNLEIGLRLSVTVVSSRMTNLCMTLLVI